MTTNRSWRIKLAQILLGSMILLALVVTRGIRAANEPVHLVTDWSHRHLIFSRPKDLMQQFRLSRDVRYVQQWVRRNAERRETGGNPDGLHKDWSMYIGGDSGTPATVGTAAYPAKYAFDVTTMNCATAAQPDFVVYNTSLAGAAGADASQTVTFNNFFFNGIPAGTVIITNGANSLTLHAAGNNTGTNFLVAADDSNTNVNANASSLANRIVSLGAAVGVTASSANNVTTITATAAGSAGNSITLTGTISGSNGVSFGGTDFTGGVNAQPTIVAFDNLYSTCTTGNRPNTYWAYNTGANEIVVTSPALSSDGKQVAFIQSTSGGKAELVLLKWAATSGTVAAPATPTLAASAAAYRTCTAPCMWTIAFATGTALGSWTDGDLDTQSSPFYDFSGSDTLYVGDNSGYLHQFTGVFNGTPAEDTTTPWPALVAEAPISSPVYDSGTGLAIVVSSYQESDNSGGRFHSVCALTAGCPTGALGASISSGIMGPATNGVNCQSGTSGSSENLTIDTPILDSTTQMLYEVLGNNGAGDSVVVQLPEAFKSQACPGSGGVGSQVLVGTGSTGVEMFQGDFDNPFYQTNAGHMYVCGNAGGTPTLYQIAVSAAGALGAVTPGPALATASTTCSEVTEVYNTGLSADYIFVSVQADNKTTAPISCPAGTGCLMSFNVTSGALGTGTATAAKILAPGGASGLTIDTTLSTAGVYYTPLASENCAGSGGVGTGTGGCAVSVTQQNLN